MNSSLLIPLLIGSFAILQGTLNRHISSEIGLAQASLLSTTVTALLFVVFYFLVKAFPHLVPSFIQIKAPLSTYKWWFIFPPLFGFFIIAGLPIAFAKLGAIKVTVLLIAAQMITSVAWDLFVEDIGLNLMKLAGVLCALASVLLVTLAKN